MAFSFEARNDLVRTCGARLFAVVVALAPVAAVRGAQPQGGPEPGTIESVYGLPPVGDGRPGRLAFLGNPVDIAADAAGNLYIADFETSRIRRLDAATGIVTTVVGPGVAPYGYDNVPATRASITWPLAITSDRFENLFLVDARSRLILRVDAASGICSVFAGADLPLTDVDGVPATSIGMAPVDVAVDRDGDVFFAEPARGRVREIDARTGLVRTVAGGGSGADGGPALGAYIDNPKNVAVDSQGNLYISDNSSLRRVEAATGRISTVAGGYGSGVAPGRVFVDRNDDVFVADARARLLRIHGPGGAVSTIAGTGTAGYAGDGGPATAAAIAVDVIAGDAQGNLFLLDAEHYAVRRIDARTGVIDTVVGPTDRTPPIGDGGPAADARLQLPTGLAWDPAGDLLVADNLHNRIRKVSVASGTIETVAGNGSNVPDGDGRPAVAAGLGQAGQVCADGRGNFYVLVPRVAVRRVDATGVIRTIASNGDLPAMLSRRYAPLAVAVDASGRLLFSTERYVYRVDPDARGVSVVAGNGELGSGGDGGPATGAQLNTPVALAVDAAGNIFLGEQESGRVRRIDAKTGRIRIVAGGGLDTGGDGGPATAAALGFPAALAVDDVGTLFIADALRHRIRRVDAGTGLISTLAGDGTAYFDGDGGPATSAALHSPSALLVERSGNLLIADTDNGVVRRVWAAAAGVDRPVVIDSADYAAKTLTLAGSGFGLQKPAVSINGRQVPARVVEQSETALRLKGSPKKLNLKPGENVVVVTAHGVTSEAFMFAYASAVE